jgi:hypothetical protein
MRLTLHTLRKDLRRLWPVAVFTWGMLAMLARSDRWRADWVAPAMEGWMNVMLTLAWVMLAGLAVLEEPLVGDRNFWTTRPHRWPALLLAKLIFLVLTIHLPLMFADLFVLEARGFSLPDYLTPLLSKQIVFFGAVTLPSIALASLVRNFTHFVIAVFAIAGGILILTGGFQAYPQFSRQASEVRHAAVWILLAATALGVIWNQYAQRRVIPARVMAVAAALGAASLSAWLPARAEYALLSSGPQRAPHISMRDASTADTSAIFARFVGTQTALLPIAITPRTPGELFRVPIVEVEVVAADGTHLRSILPSTNRPFEKIDLTAYVVSASPEQPRSSQQELYSQPGWLALRFSGPAWERLKNAKVRIYGTAAFDFYRTGETAVLPIPGSSGVPRMGRCTVMTVDDRYSEEMLKVFCESPHELPAAAIALRHEPSGREWRLRLNSAFTSSPGPHETWLSPLHRGQSFFRLTDSVEVRAGQWLVPKSYLSSAHVEVTPEIVIGHALAGFDFREVALASWRVPH